MWRSEPQIPAFVTRTIASSGCRIDGSGTVSTRIRPSPSKMMPLMSRPPLGSVDVGVEPYPYALTAAVSPPGPMRSEPSSH